VFELTLLLTSLNVPEELVMPPPLLVVLKMMVLLVSVRVPPSLRRVCVRFLRKVVECGKGQAGGWCDNVIKGKGIDFQVG
jgi:hypothetical protein